MSTAISRKTFNNKKIIFIALVACTLTSGIFTGYLAVSYYIENRHIQKRAEDLATKQTAQAAQKFDAFFKRLKDVAVTFAQDITSGKIPKDKVAEYLKKEKPEDITGLGVAFAPYAYKPSVHLYAPYYVEQEGDIAQIGAPAQMIELQHSYDYTKNILYTVPMEKGAGFLDPHIGHMTKAYLVDYVTPFYDKKNKKIGSVFTTQSIYKIQNELKNLDISEKGYGYLLSKNGSYIGHPVRERQGQTIFEVAKKTDDPELAIAAQNALNGHVTLLKRVTSFGEKSWYVFCPMPHTGWVMVGFFFTDELDLNPQSLQTKRNDIALAFLAFIIFLCLLLLRVYLGDIWRLWASVIIISCVFVSGIVFTWYLVYNTIEQKISSDDTFIVRDKNGLEKFLKNLDIKITSSFAQQAFAQPASNKKESPTQQQTVTNKPLVTSDGKTQIVKTKHTHLITGLFLQDLEMNTINSIKFIGQFWQHVPKNMKDPLKAGITFPTAYDLTKKEAYQFQNQKNDTTGWRIVGAMDQRFNYSSYPFDIKIVRIELWPKDFDKKIILVPDLEAYPVIAPKSLPALDTSMSIEGWNIEQSYFSYKKHNYLTNFSHYINRKYGTDDLSTKAETPQLIFNIILRRSVISTLMLNLAPIIIIILILFMLLFLIHKNLIEQMYQILGIIASMFFSTILAHIRFKSTLPVHKIVYFEYFYFLLYMLSMGVAILTILYYVQIKISWIRYKNLLIPLILFWPIVTGFILTMNAINFF